MRQRILLTGWFSFRGGEATAGDVLALRRVEDVLRREDLAYDVAWSPAFRPGDLDLEHVRPRIYSHLVFVSGPLHGKRITELHRRFRHCVRIAVGVSVIDADDPAVTGFHQVLARDAPGAEPVEDLAARAPATPASPVVGVILTPGHGEYGTLRQHAEVSDELTRWLAGKDCACLELDTRLDTLDWHLSATPGQLQSVFARLDLVVTDRLNGLVLGLRAGIPVLAVDPVVDGATMTAQARACGWPAVVPVEHLDEAQLERWWRWCRSAPGRAAALRVRADFAAGVVPDSADELLAALGG
ncbi:polysaccharide pyruvyl transferase family protein [Streptomyces acidicola]|uniref:polysaccharide pyruvyl transferase family protein n=1 Tax=Streptomyces acidicola TaxID=2596892 RepID=UPI00343DE901